MKVEVCKLFCSSLLCEPSDDAIQVCVCLFISIINSPQNFSSKDGSTCSAITSSCARWKAQGRWGTSVHQSEAGWSQDTRKKKGLLLFNYTYQHSSISYSMQCLGKHPYLRHKFMPTRNLATSIVQSMGGVCDGDLLDVYCRHLALFVIYFV